MFLVAEWIPDAVSNTRILAHGFNFSHAVFDVLWVQIALLQPLLHNFTISIYIVCTDIYMDVQWIIFPHWCSVVHPVPHL